MTKTFEEELKDREAETFSHWDGCTISKKEFINYADVVNLSQGWVSPEEHQARVNELIEAKEKKIKQLRKINHLYKKSKENAERLAVDRGERLNQAQDELASLESQLQQQALPVVPECVAEFVSGDETKLSKADRIAYLLKSVEGDNYYLEEYLTNAGIISQEQGEHLYAWATNQTHETILKLWDGFTVEKPQLFYLKHIDMSESDAHLNWYLAKGTDNVLLHQGIKKGKSSKLKCILKLTQQEIDSMQTGSYEQIEVTE